MSNCPISPTPTSAAWGAHAHLQPIAKATPDDFTSARGESDATAFGKEPAEKRDLPYMPLFDMHCHLDFAPEADWVALAGEAAALDISALSVTVTPEGYVRARQTLDGNTSHVRVGLGLHPWWVADGRCGEEAVALFEQLAPAARRIGEIGLDLAGARGEGDARTAQLTAFDRALAAICDEGTSENALLGATPASSDTPFTGAPAGASSARPTCPKLISFHAVRAANFVLDALEQHGTAERHRCVFHWFSGTSDELTRAVRAGCFFSVNARMLATKRGRTYARAIPEKRLLLETDAPAREGMPWSAQQWRAQLVETLTLLAETRDADPAQLAERLAETSRRLLDMA